MTLYTIPAVASLAIIGFAVLLITLAARKFMEGDFKKILTWLLVGMWFMALPYTLFIARELLGECEVHEAISWAIYLCMIVVGLCILRASMLLYNFSKEYGFADFAKKKKD
jgi:putative effector of murein hydrolase LrgA (UPF0299 family)